MRQGGCGDARSARAAYRGVRVEPRAHASTGNVTREVFSSRGAIRLAGRARRRARVEPRDVPLSGKTLGAWGGTHRTSCVSRSGSVRSTNPLGCAVITGHGTSVDGSSTIAGAAAARLGAPAPALLTAGMA